jgi:hypothetical protein
MVDEKTVFQLQLLELTYCFSLERYKQRLFTPNKGVRTSVRYDIPNIFVLISGAGTDEEVCIAEELIRAPLEDS